MEHIFSEQSGYYARYRPTYPEALYSFIFEQVARKKNAWDCGTGSGQVAVNLANHFDTVYATDISEEQLKRAPDRENIRYLKVPAEDTFLRPGLFDLVTAAQAIHWFDFERFYREVRRTTRNDAILAVFGYGMLSVDPDIDQILRKFYNYTFGTYFNENRTYVDEHYRTIPFPFEEIPSPSFETKLEWTLEELEGFFNSWSTIQRFKTERGINPADDVIDEIRPSWPEEQVREVTFPVFMRLGRVD